MMSSQRADTNRSVVSLQVDFYIYTGRFTEHAHLFIYFSPITMQLFKILLSEISSILANAKYILELPTQDECPVAI